MSICLDKDLSTPNIAAYNEGKRKIRISYKERNNKIIIIILKRVTDLSKIGQISNKFRCYFVIRT